ncbi:MAG: hypothetical protein NTV04_20465 [Deltaproteobacteria bacterium]|nr:hypothetical protein [Deltaproteobacteria bacterium]
MKCSDWIQIGLACIMLLGVLIALFQPILQRRRDRKSRIRRITTKVSLYLDVFEVKASREINVFERGGESSVKEGRFEQENKRNYWALEQAFLNSHELSEAAHSELRAFVKHFKLSRNMREKEEVETFRDRIRNPELRKYFPPSADLNEHI